MQASEIVRVAAANLNTGDEIPIAGFSAAIPYFFLRVSTICVERRELGVVREFLLRAIALGFTRAPELSGFLGIRPEEVAAELEFLEEEFFLARLGEAYSLMEKGKLAISINGLPQATEREAACYVNGITRNVEQFSGELIPKRRLVTGSLVLPAVPARPPRVDELNVAGVRTSMLLARNSLPRGLEVSRLGRVVRTAALFATGHLLLRRGVHGVPLICIDGAADTDLARPMGAHPALKNLKLGVEKNEKTVRHRLAQLRPQLRGLGFEKSETVRLALIAFAELSDAENSVRPAAETDFSKAAMALLKSTHLISGLEVQVIFAAALLTARNSLVIVVPQFPESFGLSAFEGVREAVQRGVKVELQISANHAQSIASSERLKAMFRGAKIVTTGNTGEWCGFTVDDAYVVAGASRSDTTVLGRSDSFCGIVMTEEASPVHFLADFCGLSGPVIVTKPKKRALKPTS